MVHYNDEIRGWIFRGINRMLRLQSDEAVQSVD